MTWYNFISKTDKLLVKVSRISFSPRIWQHEKKIVFLLKMLYDILVKVLEQKCGR